MKRSSPIAPAFVVLAISLAIAAGTGAVAEEAGDLVGTWEIIESPIEYPSWYPVRECWRFGVDGKVDRYVNGERKPWGWYFVENGTVIVWERHRWTTLTELKFHFNGGRLIFEGAGPLRLVLHRRPDDERCETDRD